MEWVQLRGNLILLPMRGTWGHWGATCAQGAQSSSRVAGQPSPQSIYLVMVKTPVGIAILYMIRQVWVDGECVRYMLKPI